MYIPVCLRVRACVYVVAGVCVLACVLIVVYVCGVVCVWVMRAEEARVQPPSPATLWNKTNTNKYCTTNTHQNTRANKRTCWETSMYSQKHTTFHHIQHSNTHHTHARIHASARRQTYATIKQILQSNTYYSPAHTSVTYILKLNTINTTNIHEKTNKYYSQHLRASHTFAISARLTSSAWKKELNPRVVCTQICIYI